MCPVKQDVMTLLNNLPDDCSLEGIQHHLYVLEKVPKGLEVAESQGTVNRRDAEQRLEKWLIK